MTTDRELLEMAAKAAGLVIMAEQQARRDRLGEGHIGLWVINETESAANTCWNPLQDDGDALRLAVKLHIDMRQFLQYRGVVDTIVDRLGKSFVEEFTDDPYAATRRAIVRAATEIGRNMP